MVVFETKRLVVKRFEEKNLNDFFELLSHPKIIDPIPQPKIPETQILELFTENLNIKSVLDTDKCACSIFEKENTERIGLALLLTNDKKDKELGYRFKPKY